MRSPLTSNRAMTIVEVCVAATVVLIGVVGLIQALTIGSAMLETSRSQTVAAQIIQHEINKLRLLDWDDPSTANDIAGLSEKTNQTPDSQFTAVANGFKWSRTVATPKANLRHVVLTVTWKSKITGRVYSRSGETYLGKNGLHASYQRS